MATIAIAVPIDEWNDLSITKNTEEHFPNGLKVSKTDNPMFFPVETTYQVGSAEVLALMSNAIAVGTGQTGDAPLYVFCKDGIYALFVDSSGQVAYTTSRIIARDVVNNPRSVTPTDLGIVFTTDRGLMRMAGNEVEEIGSVAEGDVLCYWEENLPQDYIKIAKGALTKIADLPISICDGDDLLTYIQGAIVNYNHNERELIVSNPSREYSFVMDREGNWTRRTYTADEYVNNYPTSYRLKDGILYKVDTEDDNNSSLETQKEADNKIYYLSNIIKLDSVGFKTATRFVVRGYFETMQQTSGGVSDHDTWQPIGSIHIPSNIYDQNYNDALYNLEQSTYDSIEVGDTIQFSFASGFGVKDTYAVVKGKITNPSRIVFTEKLEAVNQSGYYYIAKLIKAKEEVPPHLGCYVFGSYDGRKWAMLGGKEKKGTFTDIGCKIERTDVKFLRVCIAGQLKGCSRIDYMEISHTPSLLNTKIR